MMETYEERMARINVRPNWQRAPVAPEIKTRPAPKGRPEVPGDQKRARYFQGLQSKYGMTREEVIKLFVKTCGVCPICERQFPGGNSPVLDHDPATGRTRGFICVTCNAGLGYFKDSAAALRRAARHVSGTLR